MSKKIYNINVRGILYPATGNYTVCAKDIKDAKKKTLLSFWIDCGEFDNYEMCIERVKKQATDKPPKTGTPMHSE
ncbi:hypothetical protein AGMMS49991_11820 [Spirochaetia bacterium]|nr:hypothetical protein AGMMS49991_11820 [Spirochaetia bacterium]